MNPTSKKFISLFLIFSLIMISTNLYAKERRGDKLIVTKKDAQQIKGELITVKPNALLLLDAEGKDVSVGIEEIKVIRIVKKSKAVIGAGAGFLVGGLGWLTLSFAHGYTHEPLGHYVKGVVIVGVPCALIGGLLGVLAVTDKTIQIEGMSDSEIQDAMDKLRKKARIRDYK